MKLNDLKPAQGSTKIRRRVGRGIGSGRGKTSGRGQKGQASRTGFSQRPGWEGGRSSLIMRLPKRGFRRQGIDYQIVNLEGLNLLDANAVVDALTLFENGLIRHIDRPVKLLGRGELEVSGLKVDVDSISRSAAAAVEALGGKVLRPLADDDNEEESAAGEARVNPGPDSEAGQQEQA
jgi:large subunit ribosomal protein L15